MNSQSNQSTNSTYLTMINSTLSINNSPVTEIQTNSVSSPTVPKRRRRKKRNLIKQMMKSIKQSRSDKEIKLRHQEQIAKHLGGGQFKKMNRIN